MSRRREALVEALRLAPRRACAAFVRVRLIDGQPFSYLVTHVPERIGISYSEADLASMPLLSLLERSGVVVQRASQTIGATLAEPRHRRGAGARDRLAAAVADARRLRPRLATASSICTRSTGRIATPSRWSSNAPVAPGAALVAGAEPAGADGRAQRGRRPS